MTNFHNCSTCSRFLTCRNHDKGANFVCDKYASFTEGTLSILKEYDSFSEETGFSSLASSAGDESELEKDLQALLKDAMSPKNVIPPDLKVDDRDIPEFANFYEFCCSTAGLNQPPFARQLWIFTQLFGEHCPRCSHEMFANIDTWPVDYKVLQAKEHVSFLEYGICPNCGVTKSELIQNEEINDYSEVALCMGQRSGKSIGVSLANSYVLHKYLKLQDPTQVFKQTRNTHFSGTFVGLTFNRAKSLLYEPLYDMVMGSPWFSAYFELLNHYQEMYGEEIFYCGKEMMNFRHRSLTIYPASPNKRVLRGDTRFLVSVDEIGWFPYGEESNDRERAGADEVYEALDRSLLTIRLEYEELVKKGYNNVPNAYGLFASSPQANNDKIMSLVRNFKGSNSALGLQLPSWEMNPKVKRNSKAIVKAYRENPVKAERDYGANPPLADSAFIEDVTEFLHCFSNKPNAAGNYKYVSATGGSKKRRTAKFTGKLRSMTGPSMMAIDSGSSNNSFAIAIGRLDKNDRPQIFSLVEIAPDKRISLDHGKIYDNILLPLIKEHNVVKVFVDRWQSLKIIHDIEKDTESNGKFVIGTEYSLRMSDFEFVIDYMRDKDTSPIFPKLECDYDSVMNKEISTYPHCFKYEPVAHLLFQMATVRDTGRNVDKGQGYTDDVFRATMLLLAHLYDEEEVAWLKLQASGSATKRPSGFVAAGLYSGGGTNKNRTNGNKTTTSIAAVGSSGMAFSGSASGLSRGVFTRK